VRAGKHRFSEMAEFFAMGGHAAFIWPVYGLALGLLGGFLFTSLRRLRTMEREVEALEKASPRRGPRGSGGAS
jgi:heme exporter protein D